MLRNLSSPETYFQAAFRVQSPWTVTTDDGAREIIKQECYVFDFALDRALRQISDYSCQLNIGESNPEAKVGEFIQFLPALAYDGSAYVHVCFNAAQKSFGYPGAFYDGFLKDKEIPHNARGP